MGPWVTSTCVQIIELGLNDLINNFDGRPLVPYEDMHENLALLYSFKMCPKNLYVFFSTYSKLTKTKV